MRLCVQFGHQFCSCVAHKNLHGSKVFERIDILSSLAASQRVSANLFQLENSRPRPLGSWPKFPEFYFIRFSGTMLALLQTQDKGLLNYIHTLNANGLWLKFILSCFLFCCFLAHRIITPQINHPQRWKIHFHARIIVSSEDKITVTISVNCPKARFFRNPTPYP
jgi:hypothetical protein